MATSILSDFVYYDPSSKSCLRWAIGRRVVKSGDEAGALFTNPKGGQQYWSVKIEQRRHYVHRVVWALANNQDIPAKMQIDHIDGDGLNNKIENLRLVTAGQNLRNSRMRSDNTSGVAGVTYSKKDDGYMVYVYGEGSDITRKFFSCRKYGADQAFEMARIWRAESLIKANEAGAGYTARHIALRNNLTPECYGEQE